MLAGQCLYILHHLFLTTILQGKYHDTLCKQATLVTCRRVYTTEGQMRRMTTELALWTTPGHFPTVWCAVERRKKQRFTIMKNCLERSPGDRLCGPREQKVWTCSSVMGIYWGDVSAAMFWTHDTRQTQCHHALQWLILWRQNIRLQNVHLILLNHDLI